MLNAWMKGSKKMDTKTLLVSISICIGFSACSFSEEQQTYQQKENVVKKPRKKKETKEEYIKRWDERFKKNGH